MASKSQCQRQERALSLDAQALAINNTHISHVIL